MIGPGREELSEESEEEKKDKSEQGEDKVAAGDERKTSAERLLDELSAKDRKAVMEVVKKRLESRKQSVHEDQNEDEDLIAKVVQKVQATFWPSISQSDGNVVFSPVGLTEILLIIMAGVGRGEVRNALEEVFSTSYIAILAFCGRC